MDSQRIRETFLRFFQERDHRVMPSAPLVPPGDPTLLFTSAGMVQFKPYFEGRVAPPSRRLASVQKCFRTSDIDSVGDTSHLTFFEMLGNFSVGDYFKAEAIPWAWELVTAENWFAMSPDRLWAAVYLDDDEAFELWRQVGVPTERIMRYGEEHNYWFSGEVGPCGPCSELHYDLGPTPDCAECQRGACHPAVECGRFLEIWNLVFMTYFQHPDGSRTPLPAKNIDTGAGLERMAVVLQDVRSVYETDLFAPIIGRIEELCGRRYGQAAAVDRAMRIVAEHTRAAAFLIGDDKTPVLPGNEERGYAVRRVLRRAVYYGRRYLGLDRPFMVDVANAAVGTMAPAYPELRQQSEFALRIIQPEEERFEETLSRGEDLLSVELLPAHRNAARLVDEWSRQIESVMAQRPPDEWEPYFAQPSHELRSALVDMTLLIGTMTPEGIPWERVPHWLIREALSPLHSAFDDAEAAITSELRHTLDDVFQQTGAQNLADRGVLVLARQRLGEKSDLIKGSVRQVQEAAAALEKGLSGREVFVLADTYGFPVELTREIASEHGFAIDEEGFEREMEKQRERARAAAKFGTEGSADAYGSLAELEIAFLGYETLTVETTVVGLLAHDAQVESAAEGEAVEVVLRETPFYAEAGGQVGDRGEIVGPHGRVRVEDTQRVAERLIVHRGHVVEGRIAVNDAVVAQVDAPRRYDTMRNHTATHLLHAALRRVLGTHVRQAGSLVTPDRLRFDFTHTEAVKPEELAAVQSLVNDRIRADLPVRTRQSSFDEAMAEGVLAFFDEKYGDVVRIVETREDGERFSAELCGGTHCSSTGQIGLCLIVGESSIGAGMRRIEALTGRGAEGYLAERLAVLQGASHRLGVTPQDLEPKLSSILDELEAARKQVQALERAMAAPAAAGLAERAQPVDGVAVLAARVEAPSQDALRHMGDVLRQRLGSAVIVLATTLGGRPAFMAMVTPDLVKRGLHAGHILKQVASAAGGGGGGRPEMAQGGGDDPAKVDEALSLVEPTVRELLAKKG
jgi:alanyl-tRNA synthetase